jgi:hypothetical protein
MPENAVTTAVPIVVACLVAVGILGVFMLFTPSGSSHQPLALGRSPETEARVADGLGLPLPQLPPPLPQRSVRPARHDPKPSVVATPAPTRRPSAHPTPPSPGNSGGREGGLAVNYIVNGQSANSFLGQIQVTNLGAKPVAGWQIVVALTGDIAVSYTNARGYESNGVILLHPVNAAEVVPAHGTLSVYFLIDGTHTQPLTCAFNGVACGTTS